MSVVVNEIVTAFSFRGDESRLDSYNDALGDSIGFLTKVASVALAGAAAINVFTLSTTQSLDPLVQMTRRTGLAIETVQELGFVASVNGSNAEVMYSTLESLSQTIGDAARYGSEEFSRLGINVRHANGEIKDADELLLEIGERLNSLNLSEGEELAIASRLGIDSSLIQTLRLTGAEIDSLREKARLLGVTTEEEADAARSLNDSYTTLKFGIGALRNSIAVGLAPQIDSIIESFIDFVAVNRELIGDGLERVVEITLAAAEAVGRLIPFIIGVAAAFTIWKIASVGLGVVLGTVFSPVYVVTAAIVALALVIDDLIVAFQSGESVIANFFQEVFGIDIIPYIQSLVDGAVLLATTLRDAFNASLEIITNLVKSVFALLRGDFEGFKSYFSAYASGLGKMFMDALKLLWEGVKQLGSLLVSALSYGFDAAAQFLSGVGATMRDAAIGIATALTDPIRERVERLFAWIRSGFEFITSFLSNVVSKIPFMGDDDEEEDQRSEEARRREEIMRDRRRRFEARMAREYGVDDDPQASNDPVAPQASNDPVAPRVERDLQTGRPDVQQMIRMSAQQRVGMELMQRQQAEREVGRFNVSPQPAQTLQNNASNSVQQDVRIDIRTDDPRAAGSSVRHSLNEQLQDAQAQFSTGGF